MKLIQLQKWSEFVEAMPALKANWKDLGDFFGDAPFPPALFRGHSSRGWTLQTTLERDAPGYLAVEAYHRAVYESKHQMEAYAGQKWNVANPADFKRTLKGGERFLDRMPALDYLVYLRHHGFPSPLLDWSRSPYVAAFFAFNGVKDAEDKVAIYALTSDSRNMKFGDPEGRIVKSLGFRVRTHKRHFLQQCEYTVCIGPKDGSWTYASHEDALEGPKEPPGFEMRKFTLPASERAVALQYLDEFNLNAYTLFGSDDALVGSVGRRVMGY